MSGRGAVSARGAASGAAGAAATVSDEPVVPNRSLIVLCIMTATVMNSLDTTIANVALPHMQGSVSASQDQISWVLTSYIVAAAIMTPMTGWLSGRFGRKAVFMVGVAGFTIASALCGLAQSLLEIVLFRLLQGMFGAVLIPLSQAVLLDIYPQRQHGQAMAMWGAGAMLGPIMGPALGGWLTDNLSWRWVFYINLPFGILALLGIFLFIGGGKTDTPKRLDFIGFFTLSLGIGALQMMLDRGEVQDWFSSREIWIEAVLAALGFYWCAVQTATSPNPFIPRGLLADANFMACSFFGFMLGVLLFATMALLPPMIEGLLGYPVVTTGLVTAPRGFGTLFSIFLVGRLIGRVDTRLILFVGLAITALSMLRMTQFNLEMGSGMIVTSGILQGVGTGLIFVPLSATAFATLKPALRPDAAGLYTLIRNIGSSVGISIMQAVLTHSTQTAHAGLVQHIRPDNPNLMASPGMAAQLATTRGMTLLDSGVTAQASMIGYLDCFKLMMVLAVLTMPLLLFMRPPRRQREGELHLAVE